MPKIASQEGILRGFYSGFGPILFKQVPYTMAKFAVQGWAAEQLYAISGKTPQQTSDLGNLSVNLGSGVIAGVAAAVISHPADTLLSMVNKKGAGGEGSITSRLFNLAKQVGIKNLMLTGLGPRCVMIGVLTAGQFAIFDSVLAATGAKKFHFVQQKRKSGKHRENRGEPENQTPPQRRSPNRSLLTGSFGTSSAGRLSSATPIHPSTPPVSSSPLILSQLDIDSLLNPDSLVASAPVSLDLQPVSYPAVPAAAFARNAEAPARSISRTFDFLQEESNVLLQLESLKRASLHALNSLVRRIVDDEASISTRPVSPPPSSSNIPEMSLAHPSTSPKVKSLPTTPISRSREGSQLLDQANQISDGGLIFAALSQSIVDRGPSNDILRRSQDSINLSAGAEDVQVENPPLHDDLISDHGLALALAALCNGLYQIIEATSLESTSDTNDTDVPFSDILDQQPFTHHTNQSYSQLVSSVQQVQNHRNELTDKLSPAQQSLWSEIDRLMVLIQMICRQRQHIRPHDIHPPPPSYDHVVKHSTTTLSQRDKKHPVNLEAALDDVVDSIDRVINLAPRLFNQTVTLTPRQERILNSAALSGTIERLNGPDGDKLNVLVERITKAGERSLANQRGVLSKDAQMRLEEAKFGKIVDRQDRLRLINQDWESREERLLKDLNKLHADLLRVQPSVSLSTEQRFVLSPNKEKNLYMSGVAGKIGKLAERRMGNQDAVSLSERKAEDIEKMLGLMWTRPEAEQRSPMTRRKVGAD
ncbi:hypothetical protein HK096_005416 [Nowakowskiella sp. JEL0078]|nr:hypothetical protein HK096_005416 [Nowakowskiella sp. JEL0078]